MNSPMIGGDKAQLGSDLMTHARELLEACIGLYCLVPMVAYEELSIEAQAALTRWQDAVISCGYRTPACPHCNADGEYCNPDTVNCPDCKGSGMGEAVTPGAEEYLRSFLERRAEFERSLERSR